MQTRIHRQGYQSLQRTFKGWGIAQWQSACLASARPRVQSPMPHQMLLLLIITALDRKDCKPDIQNLDQPEPVRARGQPSACVALLSSWHLEISTQFIRPHLEALWASCLHFWQTDPSLPHLVVFLLPHCRAWDLASMEGSSVNYIHCEALSRFSFPFPVTIQAGMSF